ncbi:MAG: hypothetical protein LUQ33_01405 [Methanoregulaceae archaeon]|nr:hypothetical protein [Methanoregulaceae archaeon]
MMEIKYSEIGEAIGVSCARQEELFEKLVDYETRRDAITIDVPSSTFVENEDPVIRTVSILQWILIEPSFSMEDRVFLAHRIGLMVPLPDDEDDFEDEEITSDEEDREFREILLSFLRNDEGRDMFRSLTTELEVEESEEDEIEDD